MNHPAPAFENPVLDEPSLLGIADWHRSLANGASLRDLLSARLARLRRESPAEVWIRLVADAELSERLAELEQVALAANGWEDLLSRYRLFGIPFAVKDNIDVAGMPTTAACAAFAFTPDESATVVRRLLDAGAVLLGKTNLDQFATGLVGARSPYGAPSSVFAAERISGGSSSGSAVATARGDVCFALGTDTAGSGRIPAGFNNLVGIKPTPGRVSTAGVLPACRTLDCVSIFALSAEDALRVLAQIEGADARDDYSAYRPGRAAWPAAPRVRIPSAVDFAHEPSYESAWRSSVAALSGLAASVETMAFDELDAVARLLYQGPWVAERHAVVSELMAKQPEALDPTVATVISAALGYSATDTFNAQYALQRARQSLASIWDDCDVLMVPTAPRHPTHAALAADPVGVNAQLGRFTNFVNLLGWCAVAMPSGMTAEGLPFGVTFIARGSDDAALGRWIRAWEASRSLPAGGTGRMLKSDRAVMVDSQDIAGSPTRISGPAAEPTLAIAAVGAHLSGLALNWQLTERRAVLRERTRTAPSYRLYALQGTVPPKPGMVRVPSDGVAIELEVWDLPLSEVGSFLALIPSPLGLGSIELADGRWVHGFLCESIALASARDISGFGGWRAFLQSLAAASPSQANAPEKDPLSLTSSLQP